MDLAGDLHPDRSAPRRTACESSRIRLAPRTDGRRVVTTSTPVTADSQLDSPEHAPARGSRRHRWPIVGAVVVVAAAVVVGVIDPFAGGHSATPGVTDNSADPTSLQTVARQDLSSQTEVSAILGYADSYSRGESGPGDGDLAAGSRPSHHPGPGPLRGERCTGGPPLRFDPRVSDLCRRA